MNTLEKFDWKQITRIALAILTFGWGWVHENQAIIIAFAASVIVWLLGYFAERKWEVGKAVKTAVLFVVSLILTVAFTPVVFPEFPGWSGDITVFTGWIGAMFTAIETVLAAATLIYNLLLAEVLKRLPDGVGLLLKRPEAEG